MRRDTSAARMRRALDVEPPVRAAPAGPAAHNEYRFVFTSVRAPGKELQLQEIALFDERGSQIRPRSITTPGASSPSRQTAANLFDGDTHSSNSKYVDINMARHGASTLKMALPRDAHVAA